VGPQPDDQLHPADLVDNKEPSWPPIASPTVRPR
jgi:hypothetical protein